MQKNRKLFFRLLIEVPGKLLCPYFIDKSFRISVLYGPYDFLCLRLVNDGINDIAFAPPGYSPAVLANDLILKAIMTAATKMTIIVTMSSL